MTMKRLLAASRLEIWAFRLENASERRYSNLVGVWWTRMSAKIYVDEKGI